MTPLLVPLVFSLAFTTHFPLTRGTPTFAVSPAAPLILYAVNAGTLYRSNDGGISFEKLQSIQSTSVVVDPTNPEIVYDGLGRRRSDDGGRTWKQFGDSVFGTVVIHPANPAEIHLISGCSSTYPALAGVFVSYDRGDTWQHETSTCTFNIAFDPLPPYTEYRAGLFGSGAALPTRQVVADARAPQVRYGLSTFYRNVILFSDDNAITWRTFGANGPAGDSVNVLALDGHRLFAGTPAGLYVSSNGVPFWQQVPAAPPGPVLGITIAGGLLYVATPSGFFHAPLAALSPFTPAAPLPALPTPVRGIAADPHASRLYATADVVDSVTGAALGSVWRSDDGGEHWEPISGADPISCREIAVDGAGDVYAFDNELVSASLVPELFHYDAATGKAEHFSTNFEVPVERRLWADPLRRGVLYTTKNSLLYTSADGGHTWTLVASLNDGTKWIIVNSVSFDPSRAGVLYASTDAGIFRSLDSGATWSLFDATGDGAIAVAPSRSATLYRVGHYGETLSRSDDGGATWMQLPIPAFSAGILTIDPLSDRSVWTAYYRDLYHSADGGMTWTVEASFPRQIYGMAIDRDGSHLHVRLDPDATPGEFDAVIRSERRRAAGR